MSYLTEDHRPGCCPRRREKAKDPRAGEKTLVRWSRTNWGRAEEIVGDTWVGISAIGHFHRTRGEGGRDGWPRTGGQVKQTEEGRKGGCPDGRRKGSRGSIERTGRVSGLVGASSRHRPRSRSVFNDVTSSFFSSSSLVP